MLQVRSIIDDHPLWLSFRGIVAVGHIQDGNWVPDVERVKFPGHIELDYGDKENFARAQSITFHSLMDARSVLAWLHAVHSKSKVRAGASTPAPAAAPSAIRDTAVNSADTPAATTTKARLASTSNPAQDQRKDYSVGALVGASQSMMDVPPSKSASGSSAKKPTEQSHKRQGSSEKKGSVGPFDSATGSATASITGKDQQTVVYATATGSKASQASSKEEDEEEENYDGDSEREPVEIDEEDDEEDDEEEDDEDDDYNESDSDDVDDAQDMDDRSWEARTNEQAQWTE